MPVAARACNAGIVWSGRSAEARAEAGRRTAGNTETRTVARPARPRTRSPPPAPAGPAPRQPPVRASASGPFTCSSTEVRSSSRRTCSGCRSSTSASRYSATVRSLPENSAANRSGSGCPASEGPPAAAPPPSPRSAPAAAPPPTPTAARRPRQTAPALRHREAKIRGPDLGELPLQTQAVQAQPQIVPGQEHEPKHSRCPHQQQLQLTERIGRPQLVEVVDHQPEPVLQRRQVLQQPLHDRPPVQIRRRRQLRTSRETQAPSPGAPRAPTSRTAEDRAPSRHRHPRGAVRQAASSIHDRSRTVFPLPAGADTTVTRTRAPSRPNSPIRGTTPPAPGAAAGPGPRPAQSPWPIIARRQSAK